MGKHCGLNGVYQIPSNNIKMRANVSDGKFKGNLSSGLISRAISVNMFCCVVRVHYACRGGM